MVDWTGYLDRKYDILQQDANSRTTAANAGATQSYAQAGLTNTQAGQLPADSAAHRALEGTQGAYNTALGDEAKARSGLYDTQTQSAIHNLGSSGINPGSLFHLFGFSHGTSAVPGQGTGTVDTTPAMLAPGEAVLNKAAAEHLGRHTIDLLNALGQVKMGTVGQTPQEQPQQGAAPGYAKGTSDVPGKGAHGKPHDKSPPKADKGPPKKPQADTKGASAGAGGPPAPGGDAGGGGAQITPQLLQALMQMGVGGGGMAPPGAAPMPMPMPPVAGGPPMLGR